MRTRKMSSVPPVDFVAIVNQLKEFPDGRIIKRAAQCAKNHGDGTAEEIVAFLCKKIKNFSGWTGYVSATSVYPDQGEEWINEETEPAPVTTRGRLRLAAEQQWQDYANAELFRLAGIYGPHRNPFAETDWHT